MFNSLLKQSVKRWSYPPAVLVLFEEFADFIWPLVVLLSYCQNNKETDTQQ